jgi:uncharacterized protein (TIGR02118 family)
MFNVVFLVKRHPGMSQEAFARYWIEDHTPLTARVPGVRSYRCYPAAGSQDGEAPFDGVAILTFDDEAAYRTALTGAEFTAALEDAPAFQDTGQTTSFFAAEHVIVGP